MKTRATVLAGAAVLMAAVYAFGTWQHFPLTAKHTTWDAAHEGPASCWVRDLTGDCVLATRVMVYKNTRYYLGTNGTAQVDTGFFTLESDGDVTMRVPAAGVYGSPDVNGVENDVEWYVDDEGDLVMKG